MIVFKFRFVSYLWSYIIFMLPLGLSFVDFLLYNVDNESMKNQKVYQNWSFNYSIQSCKWESQFLYAVVCKKVFVRFDHFIFHLKRNNKKWKECSFVYFIYQTNNEILGFLFCLWFTNQFMASIFNLHMWAALKYPFHLIGLSTQSSVWH